MSLQISKRTVLALIALSSALIPLASCGSCRNPGELEAAKAAVDQAYATMRMYCDRSPFSTECNNAYAGLNMARQRYSELAKLPLCES